MDKNINNNQTPENTMTVRQYVDENRPFYHITPKENLDEILEKGLLKEKTKTRDGICVVRSDADDIIYEILDTQLNDRILPYHQLIELEYILIKIQPKKHHIFANQVAEDPIKEPNAKSYNFYNYLCVDRIVITEEDIIRKDLKIGNFKCCSEHPEIPILTNYSIKVKISKNFTDKKKESEQVN